MQALSFFFAFVAVLALIGVAAWLVRRFAGNRLGANTNRGRMPRLAVIDAAAVDGRRRLVLVRRDNIEHLLMIGGPTDIVVESNIVRATAGRDPMPQRASISAEPPPRIAPLPDANWAADHEASRSDGFEHGEPQMPEPPPRPSRPSFADEARRAAPQMSDRRGELLTGFTPEPLGGRPEPRPELRGEARGISRNEPVIPRPQRTNEPAKAPSPIRVAERPAAPPPPAPVSADQNLAEMAQRLEAALRRPAGDANEARGGNEARVGAPPVAPEPPANRGAQPRNEPSAPPSPSAMPASKSGFENLEDEMASLLGRPKSPS